MAPARKLDVADAVAIFVGIILGSGIFVTPAGVARASPSFGVAAALWLIGGVIAACGAFTYAEAGSRLPANGGFYVYYRHVYGEWLAFTGGWAAQLVTYPASIAAIAMLGAQYLGPLLGLPAGATVWVATALLLFSGVVNAVGARTGPWTQRLLTSFKVGAVLIVCFAAVLRGAAPAAAPVVLPPVDVGMLATAMVGILWAYDGWSDVTLVAGELERPERNLGRSVVLGICGIAAIYVVVQAAVLRLLSRSGAASSTSVFADAALAGIGPTAASLVAVLVVVSCFGSLNGIVLTGSRLGQAMAQDGVFFAWFSPLHPRWGTPARSVALLVGACLVYTWASDFQNLLEFFSQTVWTFYALTAVALLVLRRRRVGQETAWRSPLGSWPPFVVILTGLVMTGSLAWENPKRWLVGTLLSGAALPVYFVWRRLRAPVS